MFFSSSRFTASATRGFLGFLVSGALQGDSWVPLYGENKPLQVRIFRGYAATFYRSVKAVYGIPVSDPKFRLT